MTGVFGRGLAESHWEERQNRGGQQDAHAAVVYAMSHTLLAGRLTGSWTGHWLLQFQNAIHRAKFVHGAVTAMDTFV